MPNYNKSMIYKLCCNDPSIKDVYVGSTTNFTRRKHQHKNSCNNEKDRYHNRYVYRFIRDNGGFENWSMILVEDVCCENNKQLHTIEREWFENLHATLNKNIPSRTKKEYHKEYQKEYYQNNKDKKKEYEKLYYQNNKEKIKEYKKEWIENNKDKIKQYYQNNKDKINEKITCECGLIVSKSSLVRHRKTTKHKNKMKLN